MTTIQRQLENYFSSLNSMTRKIWRDKDVYKQNYPGDWDKLAEDEQEELLENHLVDRRVRDKYRHIAHEPTPEVFPKLNIRSGEKIVVDFENDDGWTWTDEHSGPFSWMTKSQQDLSLDDLDSLHDQTKKPKNGRGKSHSPDREAVSRRQREAAYSNHDKGTNAEAASTADEIFQKFGIAFSFGKDEEDIRSDENAGLAKEVEQTNLLADQQQQYENENFVLDELDFDRGRRSPTPYDNTNANDTISDYFTGSEIGSKPSSNNSSNRNKQKPVILTHDQSEAEISLMSSDQEDLEDSRGHVSPVYLEEPGESSTDPQFSYSKSLVEADSPSVLGTENNMMQSSPLMGRGVVLDQPARSFDLLNISNDTAPSNDASSDLGQWNLGLDDSKDDTQVDAGEESLVKTGFDFLDNW